MKVLEATPVGRERHQLGEGPLWDPQQERVLWVDLSAGRVFEGSLHDDDVAVFAVHQFDHTVGCVVHASDGGLLVAGHDRLLTLSPSGHLDHGPRVLPGRRCRFNDGGCDPAGRFLVGTLALDSRHQQDHLYALTADGSLRNVCRGLTSSNGLAWSPDGRWMYLVDSRPRLLWRMRYDVGTGHARDRSVLLEVIDGTPDGLAVDELGNLWLAHWGIGEVRSYTPDGRHWATVRVGTPRVSSVAFVGRNLDRLLITTARLGPAAADGQGSRRDGRLHLADVGVMGAHITPWAGASEDPPWGRGRRATP